MMSQRRSRSSQPSSAPSDVKSGNIVDDDETEEEVDDEEEGAGLQLSSTQQDFTLSQQAPEASQSVPAERPADRRNLDSMDGIRREKAIMSLSRLILFKALAREPIDRLKILKEAGISGDRISSAAIQEVADRLGGIFGFQLRRVPKYMEEMKSLPARCKDRLYVFNGMPENSNGVHSKAIHANHQISAIERGFLMLVLALTYCKGAARSDGSRWIHDRDLYRLLHDVDEAMPEEPPAAGTARAKAGTHSALKNRSRFRSNASLTPNVDALLDLYLHQDYIMREKATEDTCPGQFEEGDFIYSMGPRAAIEIGRRQIIFFCAEILDETADVTMLKEVEDEGHEDEEMVDAA